MSKTIPSYTHRCYLRGVALLPHHLAPLPPWERTGLDLILPLWDRRCLAVLPWVSQLGRAEGPSVDILPSPAFEKRKVTARVVSYVVMTARDGLHIKSLASLRMLLVESFYGILKIATEGERMRRWIGRWIPNKERRGNS